MSYPILYENRESEFLNMGFGFLSDSISCKVTEELNGSYELEMEYPVSGVHYVDIILRRQLFCRPNYYDQEQPFRIYKIDKPIGGICTIYARHISYDASGYPVIPFSASDVNSALSQLHSLALTGCPFNFFTDKTTTANFKVDVTSSVRSWLGGKTGSIIDVFGGEWHFDRYNATLMSRRGKDRGVVIRYGKNLTDIKQEENCEKVYTGVISYWKDSNGVETHGNIVKVSGTFPFVRVLSVDASSAYQDKPTADTLDAYSAQYIKDYAIGVPDVNLTVSFVQNDSQDQTIYWTDNEGVRLTDNEGNLLTSTIRGANTEVNLGDTVNIWFEEFGIDASARCIKTVWNVLTDCYDSVELGNAKANMADTIVSMQKQVDEKPDVNFIQEAVQHQTELILGGTGGHVLIGTNAAGQPNEIYIMDADNKTDAKQVLRMNIDGIGFSSTGVEGTYDKAWTLDGSFNTDYITGKTLHTVSIIGSTIRFGDDTNNMLLHSANNLLNFDSNGSYGMRIYSHDSYELYVANSDSTQGQMYNTDIKILGNTDGSSINLVQTNYHTSNLISLEDSNITIKFNGNGYSYDSEVILTPGKVSITAANGLYLNGTRIR